MEITYIRKYQILHILYRLIPNTSSFYCGCASHICKAALFFLSPPLPPLPPPYIWVLHMTPTHQMQLLDLICNLLNSCIWNHRLGEELWQRDGDRGVPRCRFLQENLQILPLGAIAFLLICPVCLRNMIMESSRALEASSSAFHCSGVQSSTT